MLHRIATVACAVAAVSACGSEADQEPQALGSHFVAELQLQEHGDCVLTDVRFPFGEAAGHLVGFCVAEPEGDDPYVACTTFAEPDGSGAEEIEFHGEQNKPEIRLEYWETPACGPAMRWARPWVESRLGVK